MTSHSVFGQLPADAAAIIQSFDAILNHIHPLNSKQLKMLPTDIRELSHLLTDERPSRRLGYMNETRSLSAYTHYFLWWNLIRITTVLSAIPAQSFQFLQDGNYLLDIGSGPLTVPIALWLAHPELREKKLTWYCIDRSPSALSEGEEIYLAIAARTKTAPWRIIRIKGDAGTEIRNPVALVACANMFNELYWNSSKPLEETAKKSADMLIKYAGIHTGKYKNALFLIIEPGIPRAARFISLLRDCFIRRQAEILAPCPHTGQCPMDGRKGGKWCHFVLPTDNAPKKLHKISEDAGLPKDRASLSFVCARFYEQAPAEKAADSDSSKTTGTADSTVYIPVRIISDQIRLPRYNLARYACSRFGLSLIPDTEPSLYASGDLVRYHTVDNAGKQKKLPADEKSGATILI